MQRPAPMPYTLFPEIEPYRIGTLDVGEGHVLTYEEVGNPDGPAVIFLHGGPGVGIMPVYRRFFDPAFYRIVLLDQRGAGRSTPHASLHANTTWTLVADLERLRTHLGIRSWTVTGGSWGSTLALCYAIAHPCSVDALIIRAVFLGRPHEIDWLYSGRGAADLYPDEWERFLSVVPETQRHDPLRAYHAMLTGNDPAARARAAEGFSRWSIATMLFMPDPGMIAEMPKSRAGEAIAMIESHYTVNNFFLPSDNYILNNVDRIGERPCYIVQGRYDVITPPRSAWDLAKALPNAEISIVQDGGHAPSEPGMIDRLVSASEHLKQMFDKGS